MPEERTPKTNSFGLVLPPSTECADYLSLVRPKKRPQGVDRHHLYWPHRLYSTSRLSNDFREHPFNSVWILRSDHNELHRTYDGVPLPPRDVMEAYLDEATLLDELGVCVRAVEMINTALYEGRVKRGAKIEEQRKRKLEVIHHSIEKVRELEVVPAYAAELALGHAAALLASDIAA